jgi:hypothetical protein
MICTYCNKEGYTENRYFKKQWDNGITPNYPKSSSSANVANVSLTCCNTCMLTGDFNEDVNFNTFIASTHMVHSKSLLSNFQKKDGVVKIGDNSEVESEGTGTFTGRHLDKYGQQIDVTLHEVLLVPTLWVNFFQSQKQPLNQIAR